MNNDSKEWGFLDILNILSFVIGVANYDENITQGQLQDMAMRVADDIHQHLQEQMYI